jgi:iron complex transport system substrate-binding protein
MAPPHRIVSLLSSATEILFSLGLGDRVVAVSHECDWPEEVRRLPRATYSRIEASADSRSIDEQVRSLLAAGEPLYGVDLALLERLRPDLIVTQAQCDVCAVRYEDVLRTVRGSAALSDCPVLALNPRSLADVCEDIRRVAVAAGVAEAGERRVAELAARVDAVKQRTARIPAGGRPRVALVEWIEPVFLAANWMPELTAWAGGDEGGHGRQGEHSVAVDWEVVADFDPQVMVIMPCGFDLERTAREARRLTEFTGFGRLSAAIARRVWAVDGNAFFNRSGPRLVESLELLAHLLHPNAHPPPSGVDPQTSWRRIEQTE